MSEVSQQAISILVVEDDPGDFGLIWAHVRLSRLGPSGGKEPLTWAKTLAEGIAAGRSNKPDVVLLDLSLPDSAGLA
ncbi:MAG: diguanylate cyclase, partial [Candidatus Ferrigenium altingense]